MMESKDKQWNIGTASEEELFSSNIGEYDTSYEINVSICSALGNISKAFNQLEVLENKMKDSPTAQDRSITTFLAEHFQETETETLTKDSVATSCSMLPDYLVVRTVVTEDYPVAATAATMLPTDSHGQHIPVRLSGDNADHQPLRLVLLMFSLSRSEHFQEKNSH